MKSNYLNFKFLSKLFLKLIFKTKNLPLGTRHYLERALIAIKKILDD